MKAACLLFLIPILTMSCAALMQRTSYTVPWQPTSAVSSANAAGKNRPRSRASRTTANRPKQLPISRKCSAPWNPTNLHQLGPDKSGGAAKAGLVKHETVNTALPVRRLSVARTNLPSLNPSLNNVRHRGPNPAVVGGSTNSNNSNTGSINGTRMHRRP